MRRRGIPVALTAIAATTLVTASQAAASRSLTAAYTRTLGGPGHATMYPSGMDIAANGDVVVADTGNDQIARYSAAGQQLWRIGANGTGTNQFQQPRDAAVDSAGNVYVADNGNGRVVKLSPSGAWLMSWKSLPSGSASPIGITVSSVGSTQEVLVADGNHNQVEIFTTGGSAIRAIVSSGTCTLNRMRDAAADASGDVYVANYESDDILEFSPSGACLRQWGSKGSGTGQFKNPYGIALGHDPQLGGSGLNAVYVADSNNDRLVEDTPTGTQVATAGTPGTATGTFTQLRRAAVAQDGSGDIWGADLWGYRVERFHRTSTGYSYAQTIGGTKPPLTPSAVFNEVRGITFDSNDDVLAMDTVNQRVVELTHSGSSIVQACGQRGFTSVGDFNWPRGVAVDPATQNIWIADTKQSDLQLLSPSCTPIVKLAGTVGTGLTQLDWPYSIAIRASDGVAWIADTRNDRVVAYSVATRKPLAAFGSLGAGSGQFNLPTGIAVDPTTGHVLVADSANHRVVVLGDTHGSSIHVLALVTDTTAALAQPYGVAMNAAGDIAAADRTGNRVAILSSTGAQLASITRGATATDTMRNPENVAFGPDGLLYVADTYNDRILVYTLS